MGSRESIALPDPVRESADSPFRQERDWRREWEAEIHCASRTMPDRGEEPRHPSPAHLFACGPSWTHCGTVAATGAVKANRRHSVSPPKAALIVAIVLASGFLPRTRAVVMPLPYRDASEVATVSHAGSARGNPARMGLLVAQPKPPDRGYRYVFLDGNFAADRSGPCERELLLTARSQDQFWSPS